MHISWFKGHKDKEDRRKKVLSYRPALNDLKEILERDFQKKEAAEEGL